MSNGMRRRGGLRPFALLGPVLAGAVLIALAPGPAAARARRHKGPGPVVTCASPRGHTTFRSGPVRLFTLSGSFSEYQSEVKSSLVGCLKPRGRAYLLAYLSRKNDPDVGVVESPRAAAPYAAFAVVASDELAGKYGQPSTESILVRSVNLANGTEVAAANFVQQPAEQSRTLAAVPNLQVAPTGWIAWLVSSATTETLYAHDSQGQRTLDSGNIDPGSLQISGSTVTWTNAGTSHSAALV